VPVKDTVAGELVALLTNETFPENGPLMPGANTMFTVRVAPAASVTGRERLALNTPPVRFAAVTVTDEFPVFRSVTANVDVFPLSTFPKFKELGDAVSRNVLPVDAVTVTVAEADFVLSATLVAFTVNVPVAAGAV
jgi:ABC-type Co2+ transport system permease subunit